MRLPNKTSDLDMTGMTTRILGGTRVNAGMIIEDQNLVAKRIMDLRLDISVQLDTCC